MVVGIPTLGVWQLKYLFSFYRVLLDFLGEMIQFDEHVFQMD